MNEKKEPVAEKVLELIKYISPRILKALSYEQNWSKQNSKI